MPRSNGNKPLPRLVPGGKHTRARREVDLPGIGASVVIEAPSVGQWQATEMIEDDQQRSMALAAAAIVEPEMDAGELTAAIKEWPLTDWIILDSTLADLMAVTEEALSNAQREFRPAKD